MAFNGTIEYQPDENGVAKRVKCPLVDDWIDPVDCLENQEVIEEAIPYQYRRKSNWKDICKNCPFRNY